MKSCHSTLEIKSSEMVSNPGSPACKTSGLCVRIMMWFHLPVTRCMLCLYFTQDIVVHVTSILLDSDICKHCISFLQYLFLWTLLSHPIALPSLSLYLLFSHYLSPFSVSFFLFHSLYLSRSFCLPFSMSFSPSCFLTKSIFIICDVLFSLHLMFWLFHLLRFYSSSNVFSNLQALTFPSSLNKKETIRRKIKI